MIYNKAKRVLSVIASILGFLLTIGAVIVVAVGIVDITGETAVFKLGDSLTKLLSLQNTSVFDKAGIQWAILIVIFILAYLNVMFIISLLKKPVLIDNKFKSIGWLKFFFSILTIIFGAVIGLYFFNDKIMVGENLLFIICLVVGVIVALLQIVSMFLKSVKKDKVKKEKKEEKEVKEEVKEEKIESETNEEVSEKNPLSQLSFYASIIPDPEKDSFEQRIREIKHLREAGLINDSQTIHAIEKIVYGITKK